VDAGSDLPSRAQVDAIILPLLDAGWESSLVVGYIDATGQVVYGYGEVTDGSGVTPDGRTLFEIGSVTKMFTELWILSQLDAGSQLDDPIASYLPASWSVPSAGGRQITLRELGDHTSGLPDFPSNIHPTDLRNPGQNYSASDLQSFLATDALLFVPGTQWSYSNTGFGLLGYTWGLRGDAGYETGLTNDLLQPLGLADTVFEPSTEQLTRLAEGHDGDLNWGPPVQIGPGLEAAGLLKSTANDLLQMAALQLGLLPSPLASAVAMEQITQFGPIPGTDISYALGLFVDSDGVIWHGGETYSFSAFLGFDPPTQKGVVVLLSSGDPVPTQPLGEALMHLAMGEQPTTPIVPATLQLTADELDKCVGTFQLSSTFSTVFSRNGNRFYAQATDQSQFGLYADAATSFYARIVGVQFVFSNEVNGKYNTVTAMQNGQTFVLTRQ
jgi:CubicO group peptidase (beta-lactamase class C family)